MGIIYEFPFELEGASARADVEWESRMGKSNGEPRSKSNGKQ